MWFEMKALLADDESENCDTLGASLFDPHLVSIQDELESLRTLQRIRSLEGHPVCDLSMVNPDLAPPRQVLDRLLESVTKTSNHRYSVSRGVRRLRESFSVKYLRAFGQRLEPETQVCVCLGSKDATFHALRVLVEPGAAVVVPEPSYPAHPSAVALAGGRSVPWQFSQDPKEAANSLAALLRESKAKVVLLNLPSNPAGLSVSLGWWREVGAVCAKAEATIVNDFVYGEMLFSGVPAASALEAVASGARCVEVYSLSKAYNVPGWRVGALVGDPEVVRAVSRVKAHADYGLFLPLQHAAAQALSATENLVRSTVQTYERRLRVLGVGLQERGWKVVKPEAGACLWAQYPSHLGDVAGSSKYRSVNVGHHLLSTLGVVLTPGIIFGKNFDSWVRFAAVVNEERLREVVRALP
jgi:alanine-synthesizing transaminase